MQLTKKNSKKWVDYSDSSEEQEEQRQRHVSPPPKQKPSQIQAPVLPPKQPQIDFESPQFQLTQVRRLEQCMNQRRDFILQVVSKDQIFLDKKMLDFKSESNPDILQIQLSQQIKGAWTVKVKKAMVQKWVHEGIDADHKIKVIVSEKNIRNEEYKKQYRERGERGGRGDNKYGGDRRQGGQKRERRNRDERGERGQRGQRRGRGRRDRDFNYGQNRNEQGGQRRRRDRDYREGGEQKKKVYVDKVTGKPATNKQECEQRLIEQKERHYTRSEAQKMGISLGSFRNKAKIQSKPTEAEKQAQQQSVQESKVKEQMLQKRPKQVIFWVGKERTEKPAEQNVKPKPKYAEKQKYVEKKQEVDENKEKDKEKKYVRVDVVQQKRQTKQEEQISKETATKQERPLQKDLVKQDN